MNYLYLLKSLLNIKLYNKYRSYIKVEKEQHPEIYYMYKILDTLVAQLNRDITIDEYIISVLHKMGKENYAPLLKIMKESDISEDVIGNILNEISNQDKAYKLAQLALAVSEGRKSVEEIKDFVDDFELKPIDEQKSPFISSNLEELYDNRKKLQGFRWRLGSLNKALGSLRKGDFGFAFARPESGKTTFLASEVSFMSAQTDKPIIWFNNEEQGNKVMLRIMQATLGISSKELFSDVKKNKEKYYELSKDNIKIIDSASIHKNSAVHIIKEYSPSLVIFDQIDKLKGFDGDRNDLRLGSIYIWAREIAKEYCPTIGVCQADGTGEGKKWLTMDNVAEAKTSKQAEADWILGIGKTHEPGLEYIRYLNISKNKLEGDEDSDPQMRHARIECLIEPEIARFRDI